MAMMATTATTMPPIAPPDIPESDEPCGLDVGVFELSETLLEEELVSGMDDVELEDMKLDVDGIVGNKVRSRCSNPMVIGCAHIVIQFVAVRVVNDRSVSPDLAGTVVVRPAWKVLVQPWNICVFSSPLTGAMDEM